MHLYFFLETDFRQHVSHPTLGNNILDIVLPTQENIINVSIELPLGTSDYSTVSFDLLQDRFSTLRFFNPGFLMRNITASTVILQILIGYHILITICPWLTCTPHFAGS